MSDVLDLVLGECSLLFTQEKDCPFQSLEREILEDYYRLSTILLLLFPVEGGVDEFEKRNFPCFLSS
jgi:hypothetical protein